MKKAIIVSGYFNPIHKGHIEYFNHAKALGRELIVIVNNDHQRLLKGSKEFQQQEERVFIVSNIKSVDQVFLSIDQDRTVCKTIQFIHQKLATHYQLAFANGGDQNNDSIPEAPICKALGIELIDGLGQKIQSSSWLLSEEKRVFDKTAMQLKDYGIPIIGHDFNRPWGGFFIIDEDYTQSFSNVFYDGLDVNQFRFSGKLSPKILMVKPGARLSWQYHHRRAEIWRVLEGPVGIITSKDNTEGEMRIYEVGEFIALQQGERHRLIGLQDWGIVAEFWQHTDALNPSDEEDIVRVQDDYLRN